MVRESLRLPLALSFVCSGVFIVFIIFIVSVVSVVSGCSVRSLLSALPPVFLTPLLSRSPGVGAHLEFLYDAFAVVCHRGSCSGGHYVSYVRRGGRWFLADDALITEVPTAVVENCMAYMVFYRLRL